MYKLEKLNTSSVSNITDVILSAEDEFMGKALKFYSLEVYNVVTELMKIKSMPMSSIHRIVEKEGLRFFKFGRGMNNRIEMWKEYKFIVGATITTDTDLAGGKIKIKLDMYFDGPTMFFPPIENDKRPGKGFGHP